MNILACIGSGGAGFNFVEDTLLDPLKYGHAPIIKNLAHHKATIQRC